jgi:hypothetical protein
MKSALSPRVLCSTLALALGAAQASPALTPAPQPTVKAALIKRRPHTLAPGTKVSSSHLGQRVFVNANDGFALAATGQAQYPAATTNGGRTWKTNGPALHVNAAQAPLSVTSIGVASRRTVFAFGGGQVVDTTADAGRKWYGALFNGLVMAVVRSRGNLVAFVDGSTSTTSTAGVTWQYVSKDGGRTWRYDNAVGG